MMATREEIVAWLDDLERVIDKSINAMDQSGDRIEVLEAALRRIRAINDNPAYHCVEIENVCRGALRDAEMK